MNRFPKLAALIFLLVLPVGIFLFLRFFGENQYDIPVYYSSGVPADTLGCSYEPGVNPYLVDIEPPGQGSAVVLLDGGASLMDTYSRNNLLRRILQNMPQGTDLMVYYIKENGAPDPLKDVFFIPENREEWRTLQCLFVTSQDKQLILIDNNGSIRGYYGLDLDEVDRLLVEMEILNLS